MLNGDMSGVQVQGVHALIYDQTSPIVCVTPSGTTAYGPNCAVSSTATQDLGGPARTKLIGDGVHIPQDLMDPFVVATWKLMPRPNRAADPNCSYCNNYVGTYTSKNDDERYAGRIDQVLTSNQRLFGRFTLQDYNGFPSTRLAGAVAAHK